MQNILAARYSGEVYLVKHGLPFEARSNVIGFVSPEYVNLFDQINTNKLKLSMKKRETTLFSVISRFKILLIKSLLLSQIDFFQFDKIYYDQFLQ